MTLSDGVSVDVISASLADQYKLQINFSDGVTRTIDFEPFLRQSNNPLIQAYLQPDRFASFHVEDGDLIWEDYGLCFPVADLYEGHI